MQGRSEIFELVSARRGHFLLESGHHGELWLDLERLFLRPERVCRLADELSASILSFGAEIICGPLVEGAFVGLLVARKLGVSFVYSERFAHPAQDGLFPAGYRVPAPLRAEMRGRRVMIVNDVISAGSSVKGTFADLELCGAKVAGIGALLALGDGAGEFAASKGVPLMVLAQIPNRIWTREDCPRCAAGDALADVGGFAQSLSMSSEPSI
jgi:orotate phosphoribosyltransferase